MSEHLITIVGTILLITGGKEWNGYDYRDDKSVELFSLDTNSSCTIRSLPYGASDHSQHQNLVLDGKKSWKLKDGYWYHSHSLPYYSQGSSIWPVDDGYIFLGGYDIMQTAVLLTHSGTIRQEFTLEYKT